VFWVVSLNTLFIMVFGKISRTHSSYVLHYITLHVEFIPWPKEENHKDCEEKQSRGL